jgi:hypothetical protein
MTSKEALLRTRQPGAQTSITRKLKPISPFILPNTIDRCDRIAEAAIVANVLEVHGIWVNVSGVEIEECAVEEGRGTGVGGRTLEDEIEVVNRGGWNSV